MALCGYLISSFARKHGILDEVWSVVEDLDDKPPFQSSSKPRMGHRTLGTTSYWTCIVKGTAFKVEPSSKLNLQLETPSQFYTDLPSVAYDFEL